MFTWLITRVAHTAVKIVDLAKYPLTFELKFVTGYSIQEIEFRLQLELSGLKRPGPIKL